MNDTELRVDHHRFQEQTLLNAAQAIRNTIVGRLHDDGLNHHDVQARVKTAKSAAEKISRRDADGQLKYPGGSEALDDLIGVRVILFVESDIDAVAIALTSQFICHDDEDKTAMMRKNGGIGYAGRHLTLEVPADNPPTACAEYPGQRFEVQIRTVLQHAWAEFEHDIRFKGSSRDNAEISRAFTMASTLIELADQQFVNISDILKRLQSETSATQAEEQHPLDAASLQVVLDRVFPDYPRSKAGHYGWLVKVMAASGVNTVSEAEAWFASADRDKVSRMMGYRFAPGQVRVADDFLLQALGEKYVAATKTVGNDSNREGKLRARLKKLRTERDRP
ncbi:GTP pyrophosphokinase [Arthrobacter glacialis]|uniref:GTP pyrophosphokinase n=1 Tax=Arthrobacter glacialis TaxID=1664 RepID=UPI0013FD5B77|nr:RelA/SpoT domain-containing protein [Arthrobacter glacialis]